MRDDCGVVRSCTNYGVTAMELTQIADAGGYIAIIKAKSSNKLVTAVRQRYSPMGPSNHPSHSARHYTLAIKLHEIHVLRLNHSVSFKRR